MERRLVATCPRCGSLRVEWHDDVALMDRVLHTDLRQDKVAMAKLEKLGVVNTYGGTGLYTSLNRVPWFLMSGLVQERDLREEQEASLREELALLKGRLAQTECELSQLKESY